MKPYKTNPFKVPKLYFEKLEALLLQETKTKLDIPFKVPQDYFESLENHIFQKTVGITKVSFNLVCVCVVAYFTLIWCRISVGCIASRYSDACVTIKY